MMPRLATPSLPPTLAHLIEALGEVELMGDGGARIVGIRHDSREVGIGDLFVAMVGASADGHKHIDAAISAGAAALLVSRRPETEPSVPVAIVPNTRAALAAVSIRFFRQPSAELDAIGVTGTNGKTTVTYILEALFRAAGGRPAIVGTTGHRFDGVTTPLPNTTPESVELQRLLRGWVDAGATHAALEVSSHGLSTHRVDGCRFAVRVFTNLSRDHLDFHGDMEAYFQAKRRLFTDFEGGPSAICVDDPRGTALLKDAPAAVTFSVRPDSKAAIRPIDLPTLTIDRTRASLITPAGRVDLDSSLPGMPNLENLLAAAAVGVALDLPVDAIRRGLSTPVAVPGRFQRVADLEGGRIVIVDYAHTPEALSQALKVVRTLTPGRVGVVFGCGGSRDAGKRPEMGRAAADGADQVFLTSDNPRWEDPDAILEQALAGVPAERRGAVEADVDRTAAIEAAIAWARPGDAVLVAGKGHETYQEIRGERRPFDDISICRRALAGQEARWT